MKTVLGENKSVNFINSKRDISLYTDIWVGNHGHLHRTTWISVLRGNRVGSEAKVHELVIDRACLRAVEMEAIATV